MQISDNIKGRIYKLNVSSLNMLSNNSKYYGSETKLRFTFLLHFGILFLTICYFSIKWKILLSSIKVSNMILVLVDGSNAL